MSCKKYFDDWVCDCPTGEEETTTLLIRTTGVTSGTPFFATFKDKNGSIYVASATADEMNNIAIDMSALPAGFLNPYIGPLELELFNDEQLCDRYDIPVKATYETIALTVKGGNSGKLHIGCL